MFGHAMQGCSHGFLPAETFRLSLPGKERGQLLQGLRWVSVSLNIDWVKPRGAGLPTSQYSLGWLICRPFLHFYGGLESIYSATFQMPIIAAFI